MLLGSTKNPGTYQALLHHAVWESLFDWLKSPPQGENNHHIQGNDVYAIVSTISTSPRTECLYESHRLYLDLHYCVEGGELIEWSPRELLTPQTEYDEKKDVMLYENAKKGSVLRMTPGTFAIFFPDDAHMPKISDGMNTSVKKVVVKIKTELVK